MPMVQNLVSQRIPYPNDELKNLKMPLEETRTQLMNTAMTLRQLMNSGQYSETLHRLDLLPGGATEH